MCLAKKNIISNSWKSIILLSVLLTLYTRCLKAMFEIQRTILQRTILRFFLYPFGPKGVPMSTTKNYSEVFQTTCAFLATFVLQNNAQTLNVIWRMTYVSDWLKIQSHGSLSMFRAHIHQITPNSVKFQLECLHLGLSPLIDVRVIYLKNYNNNNNM